MRRALSSCLLFLLFLWGSGLFAQDEDYEDPQDGRIEIDSDWYDFYYTTYTRGDRIFNISLGVLIPTYFSGIDDNNHGMSVGGTGTLGYYYFLSPNIFIGGELSGSFSGTRAGNMLYVVPFGVRGGYQFVFRRFEFPLSVMIGAAPQRYLEDGYFGLIVKPSASAFWRFNHEWSFGLNTHWWLVPQYPKEGPRVVGNFLELTLSARYHF
ncbi:MAG: hypothetical protein FWH12_09170 [Treponema sp.]|nr:hypothetical protein [Treponema sp.]